MARRNSKADIKADPTPSQKTRPASTAIHKSNVDTKHVLYNQAIYRRLVARDCVDGSDAIKRKNELYLPIPTGMYLDQSKQTSTSLQQYVAGGVNQGGGGLNTTIDLSLAPYYHWNRSYMAYLQAARFPEIPAFALRGLVGTATRKPMDVKLPSQIKYLEEKATLNGMNLQELFGWLVAETMQEGNVALAVEVNPKDNTLYFCTYKCETHINWKLDNEDDSLLMAVFSYKEDKEADEFSTEKVNVELVYSYEVKEGSEDQWVVTERKYEDQVFKDRKTPSLQGITFEDIPVVYIGARENTPTPQPAPLNGIYDIALSIYRKDADLSNSEHMTCNPNLVISGGDSNQGIPSLVGSTVALILENPQAKAYYTSTDTSGLSHVSSRIESLYLEAMMFGASLTGPSKKGVESVETVKMRQNYQGATLIDVVRNVAAGLERACEIAAQLHGADKDAVECIANEEFSELLLSPQMITALVQAWIASGLSLRTLLENFKDAGMIKDVEEEIKRINSEGLSGGDPNTPTVPTKKPGEGGTMPPGGNLDDDEEEDDEEDDEEGEEE